MADFTWIFVMKSNILQIRSIFSRDKLQSVMGRKLAFEVGELSMLKYSPAIG